MPEKRKPGTLPTPEPVQVAPVPGDVAEEDSSVHIEMKGAKWLVVCATAAVLIYVGFGIYNQANRAIWNARTIELGEAVDCATRPNPAYLRCIPAVDGPECGNETATRLMRWHASIDYVCAQYESDRPFVFPVRTEQEMAEAS